MDFLIADYSRCRDARDVGKVSPPRNSWCGRVIWCIMWGVSLALRAAPRWTKATISVSGTDSCIVGRWETGASDHYYPSKAASLLVINEFDDEVDRSTRRFVAPSRSSLSPIPSVLMTVVESLNDGHWNGWIRVSGSEKTIVTADTVGCENKRSTKGEKKCVAI